jgi:hypothetical protein
MQQRNRREKEPNRLTSLFRAHRQQIQSYDIYSLYIQAEGGPQWHPPWSKSPSS